MDIRANLPPEAAIGARNSRAAEEALVCRVDSRLCAVPLEFVIETTRALPIDPLPGAPPSVCGVSIVRGEPIAVLDLAQVLGATVCGDTTAARKRFVIVRLDARRVAFAVDDVIGLRAIPAESLSPATTLLRDSEGDRIAAIGALDAKLLLLLRVLRIVPEGVWAALEAAGAAR